MCPLSIDSSPCDDLQLYELTQLIARLYQSPYPEAASGSLLPLLQPLEKLGLILISHSPSDYHTVSRCCPGSMLLHYFWSTWMPAYYRSKALLLKGNSKLPIGSSRSASNPISIGRSPTSS